MQKIFSSLSKSIPQKKFILVTFIMLVALLFPALILANDELNQLKPNDISQTQWLELTSAMVEAKLLPVPSGIGGENSQFGFSVSVDGDRALVGGPNMLGHGVVYVFDFDGSNWLETTVLIPSDGQDVDYFGHSVSLSGTRALIGAYGNSQNGANSGAAYVFDFDGSSWTQNQKLLAIDGVSSDQFGYSVSLSGDWALVGASHENAMGNYSGSAYLFAYSGASWSQDQKIMAADGAFADNFAASVSLSGTRLLVGSPNDDDNGSGSGSAYVFDYDGMDWLQSQKLTASDAAASDKFGYSVSLLSDRVLIGAYNDDDFGSNSGSAYIFDFDGNSWNQSTKLNASDGDGDDFFAYSVTLSVDRALIGAHLEDENGLNSGSAYIFDYDGMIWNQSQKILATDGITGDSFAS